MNNNNANWTPLMIIALAIGAGIVIVALCAGISLLITGFSLAGWLSTATAVAGTTAAVGGAGLVVKTVVEKAKEKPLAWLTPGLSILASLTTSINKELFDESTYQTISFTAVVAVLFALAGLLWNTAKLHWSLGRVVPCALFAIPSLLILGRSINWDIGTVAERLAAVGGEVWLAIAAPFFYVVVFIALSWHLHER